MFANWLYWSKKKKTFSHLKTVEYFTIWSKITIAVGILFPHGNWNIGSLPWHLHCKGMAPKSSRKTLWVVRCQEKFFKWFTSQGREEQFTMTTSLKGGQRSIVRKKSMYSCQADENTILRLPRSPIGDKGLTSSNHRRNYFPVSVSYTWICYE